jgi:hypothetical protein
MGCKLAVVNHSLFSKAIRDVLSILYCLYFGYCRQVGGTGELINDIFGSSDEDDEDFAVSSVLIMEKFSMVTMHDLQSVFQMYLFYLIYVHVQYVGI